MLRVYKGSDGYFIVDNFEFKGMYKFDNDEDMMLSIDAPIAEVKNCYFHGWGHAPVTDLGPCDLGSAGEFSYCNYWDGGKDAGKYA